jgi:hypothetical protein
MIKLWGMHGAYLVGVLMVVPACVIAAGFSVVSSLAASANRAPTIGTSPNNPSTSQSATFTFTSSKTPTGYQCALDTLTFTPCTSPATYTGLADGSHKFGVEARYSSGTSNPANATWKIIPAAPVITGGPANGSSSADASPRFTFTDTTPNVAFTCWVDAKKHSACGDNTAGPSASGSGTFSNLGQGSHCFNVFASDANGYKSATTQDCWIVVAPQGFQVGSDLTGPLYPGTSELLNLTFTNPNPDAITVGSFLASSGDIQIAVDSSHPGCAASNFDVKQGLGKPVTIPGGQNKPISLSALHVDQAYWPVIEMVETGTNQDACQGAQLKLTYSGIEATG